MAGNEPDGRLPIAAPPFPLIRARCEMASAHILPLWARNPKNPDCVPSSSLPPPLPRLGAPKHLHDDCGPSYPTFCLCAYVKRFVCACVCLHVCFCVCECVCVCGKRNKS